MPRWVAYTFLTMLLWGGWGLASKPVSMSLSAWQVQSLSTLGLLPVLAVLALSPALGGGSDRRLGFWLGFTAGIITSAGNLACYRAMAAGGKATAVIPLTSLYPVVTVVLALVLLHERLNRVQLAGVVGSLLALYLFNTGPESALLSPWLVVALVPILLWGVSALFQKIATFHASSQLVTLAFLLGFLPLALLTPLFQPFRWEVTGWTWGLLLLIGFFFALGNLTLVFAYGTGGRASIVTPLACLYSLVTIPLAVLMLDETFTGREVLAVGVALLAVVALVRETPASPPERDANSGLRTDYSSR